MLVYNDITSIETKMEGRGFIGDTHSVNLVTNPVISYVLFYTTAKQKMAVIW
jgi:hypothetical protein